MEQAYRIESLKAVYFSIPKVACTSIKQALLAMDGIYLEKNIHPLFKYPQCNYDQWLELKNNYFCFTFIRSPWDRLLSCYKNKIKECKESDLYYQEGVFIPFLKYKGMRAGMSFSQFANLVCEIPDEEANPHFKSQYTFLPEKEKIKELNFIGRFENLEKDFQTLCQALQQEPYPLKHLMQSEHRPYPEYYSRELADKVAKRYEQDIALFEYRF